MSKHQNKPMGRGPMGGHGMGSVEKAKNFKGTMRKFLTYLKPFRMQISFVIFCAICSTIFTIVGPKILGNATTILADGLMLKFSNTGGIDFDAIGQILIFLFGIYVLSAIFSYAQHWIMSGITQKIAYNLRNELALKINRLPLKYFDTRTHGEVLSRVTNDIDTIAQSLNQSLQQALTSVVTIIGIIIMMLLINVEMTMVALCIIPLSGIFVSIVIKKSQGYFKAQQTVLGEVNGHVEEMYGGHIVVKAFNGEADSIKDFSILNDKCIHKNCIVNNKICNDNGLCV